MTQTFHSDTIKEQLDKKIDDTLTRYQYGIDTTSDGYNILRWARKGYLTRKAVTDETTK